MTEATNSVPQGDSVSLTYNGKTVDFPVLRGTEGNPAIDLSSLTIDIAEDVTHVLFWSIDFDFHDRLEEDRFGFF